MWDVRLHVDRSPVLVGIGLLDERICFVLMELILQSLC